MSLRGLFRISLIRCYSWRGSVLWKVDTEAEDGDNESGNEGLLVLSVTAFEDRGYRAKDIARRKAAAAAPLSRPERTRLSLAATGPRALDQRLCRRTEFHLALRIVEGILRDTFNPPVNTISGRMRTPPNQCLITHRFEFAFISRRKRGLCINSAGSRL